MRVSRSPRGYNDFHPLALVSLFVSPVPPIRAALLGGSQTPLLSKKEPLTTHLVVVTLRLMARAKGRGSATPLASLTVAPLWLCAAIRVLFWSVQMKN